jgi:hypothetical protein
MAHLPIGGPAGSLARLSGLAVERKIYANINNTNPILREDSPERRAVERLLAARSGQGHEFVMGGWHTLAAATPGPAPRDEFWNTFHFGPRAASYLAGAPLPRWPGGNAPWAAMSLTLTQTAIDGDAILRLDDQYIITATMNNWKRQPLQLWKVRRIDRAAGTHFDASEQPPALRPRETLGKFYAFARDRATGQLTGLGEHTWAAGQPLPLPVTAPALLAASIDAVVLIGVEVIPLL